MKWIGTEGIKYDISAAGFVSGSFGAVLLNAIDHDGHFVLEEHRQMLLIHRHELQTGLLLEQRVTSTAYFCRGAYVDLTRH